MSRLIACALLVGILPSLAEADTPKKRFHIYKTEYDAQRHCGSDPVVWASTKSHLLYLPSDKHYAHTLIAPAPLVERMQSMLPCCKARTETCIPTRQTYDQRR
jgi:hypothetical protein